MPAEPSKQTEAEDDNSILKTNKRRQPNKYSLTNDNKHSLRRDLLLSNFDRTMTVEKARFEPNVHEDLNTQPPIIPKIDVTSDPELVGSDSEPAPPGLSNNNSLTTYALTMSPSAPTLSTIAAGGGPPPSATLSNDRKRLTLVKSEGNQSSNNGVMNSGTAPNNTRPPTIKKLNKKPSKNAMHHHHYGTASPAEVFHRNLVDAVSNVDDSDENEHYVYPYTGNESCTTIATNNNGLHRPLSVRSTPPIFNQQRSIGDWIRRTWSPRKEEAPMPEMEEEEVEWSGNEQHYRRPKLRNRVIDHPTSHRSNSLLNLWHDSFNKKYGWPAAAAKKSYFTTQKSSPLYHHGGGYTSDEEDAPLLRLKRQQQQQQKRLLKNNSKKKYKKTLWNIFLSLLFILIGFFFVIIYKAQPLTELTVDIGRVLATDKELIFDLKVQAENPNWWTIHIADADISVFAFSQIVPSNIIVVSNTSLEQLDDYDAIETHTRGVDPAEYLGNLKHFDEPLSILPNRFNNHEAISQIRIKSPGADISGNERWSRMIRYPYGLVVRGVLKYKPVSFLFGVYPQSAAVCNVTRVDPTTGTVSSDPDKSFCVSQDQVNIFSHASPH